MQSFFARAAINHVLDSVYFLEMYSLHWHAYFVAFCKVGISSRGSADSCYCKQRGPCISSGAARLASNTLFLHGSLVVLVVLGCLFYDVRH